MFAQPAASVMGVPLNGAGFGSASNRTWACTGAGVGAGVGVGCGVSTGVGPVGGVFLSPQPIAMSVVRLTTAEYRIARDIIRLLTEFPAIATLNNARGSPDARECLRLNHDVSNHDTCADANRLTREQGVGETTPPLFGPQLLIT